ncbi:MAG TPA: hypothetical protein VFB52_07235 [Solirubrobacterales bacterium]|nr:hypothetical protein [Solirubrobacterales bacterium]
MAPTKTKKASGSKAKPAAKKAAAKRKRTTPKRATPRRKASSAKPAATSNGAAHKPSANGHSSKAAIPLLAGGAVLAGTIGGVLIGASNSGKKVLGVSLPQPKRMQVKLKSSDLASAAKQVGRFGENVGELTAELKRAREGLVGDGKHDSPIEVLLRGLSARR